MWRWQVRALGVLGWMFQAVSADAETQLPVHTVAAETVLCVKALPGWDFGKQFGKSFNGQTLKWWEYGPPVPFGFAADQQLGIAIEHGSCWRAEAEFRAILRQSLNPIKMICNFGGPPGWLYLGPYEIELEDGRRLWTNRLPDGFNGAATKKR